MARAKQRKTAPVTHPAAAEKPAAAGIPPPFPVPDIAGPSAQELAAHGSAFLTQAILVQQKGDTPPLPIHDDVMTADAFAIRELMLGLSLLGMGEVYATRLQRLAGVVHALFNGGLDDAQRELGIYAPRSTKSDEEGEDERAHEMSSGAMKRPFSNCEKKR